MSEPTREELGIIVEMEDDAEFGTAVPATDDDLAAMGYIRVDVDVEALREVIEGYDSGWPVGNVVIETLMSTARQVLAALDGEGEA